MTLNQQDTTNTTNTTNTTTSDYCDAKISNCLSCAGANCRVCDFANLYAINSDKKSCKKCDTLENCAASVTCSECTTCAAGYAKCATSKLCVELKLENDANCAENAIYLDANCKPACSYCKENYYLKDGVCTAFTDEDTKIENCMNYGIITNCVKCAENFTTKGNKCEATEAATGLQPTIIDNCAIQDSYYYKCNKCTKNSGSEYYLFDDNKKYKEYQDEFLDKKTTILVNNMYNYYLKYKRNDFCQAAKIENCFQLEEGQLKCKVCNSEYYKTEDGKCLKADKRLLIASCVSYLNDTKCSKCADGFSLKADGSSCVAIPSNCYTFDANSGNCSACINNTIVAADGKSCEAVTTVVENCYIYESKTACKTCITAYYLSDAKCITVDGCSGSDNTKCTSCKDEYFKNLTSDNKCILRTDPNCTHANYGAENAVTSCDKCTNGRFPIVTVESTSNLCVDKKDDMIHNPLCYIGVSSYLCSQCNTGLSSEDIYGQVTEIANCSYYKLTSPATCVLCTSTNVVNADGTACAAATAIDNCEYYYYDGSQKCAQCASGFKKDGSGGCTAVIVTDSCKYKVVTEKYKTNAMFSYLAAADTLNIDSISECKTCNDSFEMNDKTCVYKRAKIDNEVLLNVELTAGLYCVEFGTALQGVTNYDATKCLIPKDNLASLTATDYCKVCKPGYDYSTGNCVVDGTNTCITPNTGKERCSVCTDTRSITGTCLATAVADVKTTINDGTNDIALYPKAGKAFQLTADTDLNYATLQAAIEGVNRISTGTNKYKYPFVYGNAVIDVLKTNLIENPTRFSATLAVNADNSVFSFNSNGSAKILCGIDFVRTNDAAANCVALTASFSGEKIITPTQSFVSPLSKYTKGCDTGKMFAYKDIETDGADATMSLAGPYCETIASPVANCLVHVLNKKADNSLEAKCLLCKNGYFTKTDGTCTQTITDNVDANCLEYSVADGEFKLCSKCDGTNVLENGKCINNHNNNNKITNCIEYSNDGTNNICLRCASGYVMQLAADRLSSTCKKESTILDLACSHKSDTELNCAQCKSGYFGVTHTAKQIYLQDNTAVDMSYCDANSIYVKTSTTAISKECRKCKDATKDTKSDKCTGAGIANCTVNILSGSVNKCDECAAGYGLLADKLSCSNKVFSCKTYGANDTTCTKCVDNYYLRSNICYSISNFASLKTLRTTKCATVHAEDDGKTYCIASGKDMIPLEGTTKIIDKFCYELVNNTPLSTGCSKNNVNGVCIACADSVKQYLKDSKTCTDRTVIEQCSTYSSNNDTCSKCNDGYFLSANAKECVMNPKGPANCAYSTQDSVCLVCNATTYLKDGTCEALNAEKKIADNCAGNSNADAKCAFCNQNYLLKNDACEASDETFVDNKSCYYSMIYGYAPVDTKCICIKTDNFFNGTSKKCEELKNCAESDGNGKCTKCYNHTLLENDACVAVTTKVNNCYKYSSKTACEACDGGYELVDNKCNSREILSKCAIDGYATGAVCGICKPGYKLSADRSSCEEDVKQFVQDFVDAEKSLICNTGYEMTTVRGCEASGSSGNSTSSTYILLLALLAYLLN